jgi:MarR family transcriptional repressor of emrRAB
VTSAEQQANLLGAFALAVADRASAAVAQASGQSDSASVALSALQQFLDGTTLDRLCQVLGLTPSGAVRLVDRLSEAGLVGRAPGADGRSRAVSLTAKGRRLASKIGTARLDALEVVLEPLSAAERATFQVLLAKLMAGVVEDKDGGAWLCRICDLRACGRPDGQCPTANAALLKTGTGRRPAPAGDRRR